VVDPGGVAKVERLGLPAFKYFEHVQFFKFSVGDSLQVVENPTHSKEAIVTKPYTVLSRRVERRVV